LGARGLRVCARLNAHGAPVFYDRGLAYCTLVARGVRAHARLNARGVRVCARLGARGMEVCACLGVNIPSCSYGKVA